MQTPTLRGCADIEDYAFAVCDWLKYADLDSDYCDLQLLLASFRCLASAARVPRSPELVLHPTAGWPLYRTFIELIGQHAVAGSECRRLEESIRRSAVPSSAAALLRRKLAHYRDLQGCVGLFKEGSNTAALEGDGVDPLPRFRVQVDRIDQSGCLERLTVELHSLQGRRANRHFRTEGQGSAKASERLTGLIYRLARCPLEHCLAHLQTVEGLAVTRLAKGRLGPFLWRRDAFLSGVPWFELVTPRREPTLLCHWRCLTIDGSRSVRPSQMSKLVVAEGDAANVRKLLERHPGLAELRLSTVPNR